MIDVLVVDDHPIVLAGLAALIGSDPQLSVVGTAR
jgi:YesN/AraC family two-component response regulator